MLHAPQGLHAFFRAYYHYKSADWTDNNLSGLAVNRDLLAADSAACLDLFMESRRGGVFRRLSYLRRSGVYRQTLFGTLGLYFATITGRV